MEQAWSSSRARLHASRLQSFENTGNPDTTLTNDSGLSAGSPWTPVPMKAVQVILMCREG